MKKNYLTKNYTFYLTKLLFPLIFTLLTPLQSFAINEEYLNNFKEVTGINVKVPNLKKLDKALNYLNEKTGSGKKKNKAPKILKTTNKFIKARPLHKKSHKLTYTTSIYQPKDSSIKLIQVKKTRN